MTDKQIIIDGIDVSGCEDYKCDGTCANSAYHLFNFETKYANCKNRNCYYKQLKAKEQECEELKEENFELKEEVSIDRALFEEIDQLKKENEELKEELQKYKNKQQEELELKKLLADSFKEMQHDLYKKFNGNSLIEKRNPYGN